MKFPFVPRRRFEAQRALDGDHAACIAALRRDLETVQARLREVEQISELRHQEVAQLQEVQKLCERRAREIAIMHTDLALAAHTHVLLLDELKEARHALPPRRDPLPASRQPLPLMIGVDVEPDKREVDRQDPSWHGAATFFQKLPELRQRLDQLAGRGGPVVFTWFVRADPQVEIANGDTAYAFHRFAEEWRRVLAAGDEIGLHVHPWRWEESTGRWLQDHADTAWTTHCVQTAFDTYCRYFGTAPRSYCGGDRFLSNAVARKLEELGIQVDFSLERMPGTERLVPYERSTGSIPDTLHVPNRAFRPSAEDFRLPDPARRTGPGLLPLTAYPGGHLSAWAPPEIFARGLELVLQDSAPLTHLAFIVRTDIALAPSWDHFMANIETLARWAKEGALQFATGEQSWARARQWLDAEAAS